MRTCRGIMAAVIVVGVGLPARAQTPRPSKWEVELHGGGEMASMSTGGSAHLPPAGPGETTTVIVNGRPQQVSTRFVSSWFLRDGAAFLGQVFNAPAGFGITPLDPLLATSILTPRNGGSVGFRVGRRMSSRFTAEISFDRNIHAFKLNSGVAQQIDTSRASFAKFWGALAGPFDAGSSATAVATLADERGSQSLMTGTLLIDIGGGRRVLPYAAIGAGAMRTVGQLPSIDLTGDYRFVIALPLGLRFPGGVSNEWHETDNVALTGSARAVATAVFGGGARFALSPHSGIRIDIRDHVSRDTRTTILDARPVAAPAAAGTVPSFILIGTDPVLRISNSDAAQSTLSTPVTGFEAFKATGAAHYVNLSAGVYWRF